MGLVVGASGTTTGYRNLNVHVKVTVVGGTDAPWTYPPDVAGMFTSAMRTLWDGATRSGIEAGAAPEWMTDQSLIVEEGLDLLTRAGAYATFEEDRKGTITVGKLADLVVLSDDPRSVPLEDLPAVAVVMTLISGRVEYDPEGLSPA